MKKILFACVAATAAVTMFAADPNPYADYDKAMASCKAHQMAVEWHNDNGAAIAAATEPAVLAAFVANPSVAKALLDNLRCAYLTDPLVMTQIAAVTQWVMTKEPFILFFWEPSPAAGRKVWIAALEEKIRTSEDSYVRTFCRQQLDLCK